MKEKTKRVRPYLKLIVRVQNHEEWFIVETERFPVCRLSDAYERTKDWSTGLTAVNNDCELWLLSDVGMMVSHWENGKEQLF